MARRTGSTNTAHVSAEQAADTQTDDTASATEAPPTAQPGEQGPPGGFDVLAVEEPGPEDFARHTGARLIQDHEHDLALQAEVDDRIRRRGHEIATRLRKSGPNATVTIGGKEHVARQRPANSGGGMLLAEVGKRVAASLD